MAILRKEVPSVVRALEVLKQRMLAFEVELVSDMFGHMQYISLNQVHISPVDLEPSSLVTSQSFPVLLVTLLQVAAVVLVHVFTVFGQLFGCDFSH